MWSSLHSMNGELTLLWVSAGVLPNAYDPSKGRHLSVWGWVG
ncbi:hypothetical protein [Reinekea blandensis]|nr:hypothetical protein [Reinekea blandensis]